MRKSVAVLLLSVVLFAGVIGIPYYVEKASAPAAAPLATDEAAVEFLEDPVIPLYSGVEAAGGQTADGESGAIDLAGLPEGYIMARCTSRRQARLVVSKDGQTQTQQLPANGAATAFALTMGNGGYRAAIYLQIEGEYYENLAEVEFTLALADELAPYRLATGRIPFGEGSQVYRLARQLAQGCKTPTEYAGAALDWVTRNIAYDEALVLARQGMGSVFADPDEVIRRGTGTCLDFATLYAALMRAGGVPCQMVFGWVDTPKGETLYHAWNLVWLPTGQGAGGWQLRDPTFSHSGAAGPEEMGYAYSAPEARY